MKLDGQDYWGDRAPREALVGIDRDPEVVQRLQELFGEAGHVFKCHPYSNWTDVKDKYASDLVILLKKYPGLVGRLLKLENRLIKMITYRALELRRRA